MKKKIIREYKRRIVLILKSKQNEHMGNSYLQIWGWDPGLERMSTEKLRQNNKKDVLP